MIDGYSSTGYGTQLEIKISQKANARRKLVTKRSFGKFGALFFFAISLAACGGGGGGGGGSVGLSATLSAFQPSAVDSSRLSTQGSPSGNISNDYGLASATLVSGVAARSASSFTIPDTNVAWQFLPRVHIDDTRAADQWALGWTGAGQSIAVIDDFSSSINTHLTISATRDSTYQFFGAGTGSYTVNYRIPFSSTHGALVSNIAGGDGLSTNLSSQFTFNSISATRLSCTSGTCYDVNIYTSISDDWDSTSSITYRPMAGVAKDALVVNNHVDLSPYQNVSNTLNSIVSHMDNSYNASAINLSIGFNINTVGVSLNQILDDLDTGALQRTSNAVVVVAAGNSGAACTSSNLNGCNALAVAAAYLPQTKHSAIIAGATSGTGLSENIATYSARAGVLADRFLLASGHTGWLQGNDVEVVGTSFAAPRIAGAAALLRHKFPNLNAEQTASILLLTGNKDINNDGVADFSGVSPIYGHGKLNLPSAMSPIGSLGVR